MQDYNQIAKDLAAARVFCGVSFCSLLVRFDSNDAAYSQLMDTMFAVDDCLKALVTKYGK